LKNEIKNSRNDVNRSAAQSYLEGSLKTIRDHVQ
jgi:hypothetical protein